MNKWLPWAVAVSGAIALAVALDFFDLGILLITPWAHAETVATLVAINEFGSGIADVNPYWSRRLQALASLLVIFVIAPSLWILSEIRNRAKKDDLKKGFIWYGSVMITGIGLFIALSGATIKTINYSDIWQRASISKNQDLMRISKNKDLLRRELTKLAYDVYELYYLPQHLGGGGQSFNTIQGDGKLHSIQLSNLESYNASSANSFVLASVSENSIIIYGIGYETGPDSTFKNINGDQGKLQLAVEVSPPNDIVNFVKKNTNSRF
ncbi:MAG TPA: hypothetical protein VF181_11890 [Balneolaceae bacterium]